MAAIMAVEFSYILQVTLFTDAGVPQYSPNFSKTMSSCTLLDTNLYGPVPTGCVAEASTDPSGIIYTMETYARKSLFEEGISMMKFFPSTLNFAPLRAEGRLESLVCSRQVLNE